MKRVVFLTLGIVVFWVLGLWAVVPQLINLQGNLRDGGGNPVANGSYAVTFTIYDAPSGGNIFWAETTSVSTAGGSFNVLLGASNPVPDSLFNGTSRYLEIKVGADPPMTPRQRMSSVGYSFVSGQWNSAAPYQPEDIFRLKGNVGIGTAYPGTKLDVWSYGTSTLYQVGVRAFAEDSSTGYTYGGSFEAGASGTGYHYGVFAQGNGNSSSGETYGTYGLASGNSSIYASYGSYGEGRNLGSHIAVGGRFSAPSLGTGTHVGVAGEGYGSSNQAAYGATGAAINYSTGLAYGVYGVAQSTSGDAYGGFFTGSSLGGGFGYGIYCKGDSSLKAGVGGYFQGSSSTNYSSLGVQALATNNSTGLAVGGQFIGSAASGNSYGAVGQGTYGVYGISSVNGGAAVFGNIGGNFGTYGGYFQGDVKVERNLVVDGFIFKNGGGFRIDHPTDPSNKYLYHSFVESPDMTNFYNGNVNLDARGEATVKLPDWFGALNKDFRYQLTAIGVPGPNLYIAEKVSYNHFRIAGGTPGMEVSWQVTGIRQDGYANAHRISVEEEKTGKERGKYLHPKELGLSETLGMHYEETQKIVAEQKKMEEERKQQEEQRAKMEQKAAPAKKER